MLTAVISIPVADHMLHKASRTLTMSAALSDTALHTAAGSKRGRRSSRPSVSSRGTRTILKEPETRRLKNRGHLARNRRFESPFLQQTVSLSPAAAFQGREPRFSARVWAAGLATGSAETRQALHCAPTGGNISVGPYSSTAVPLRWVAKMPRRSRQSWVYSALKVRGSLKFGLGSSKAEHGPLIVPGKRKT